MNINYINKEYKPGEDFFKFATDKWIDYHTWNKEYSRWGTFSALDEEVDNQLRDMLSELKNDSNNPMAVQMNKFYAKLSDYKTRNSENGSPLLKYIERINSTSSKDELLKLVISEYLLELFICTGICEDEKSPDDYIICMQQSLFFDNRDYYDTVSTDDNKLKYIRKFKEVVKEAFDYLNISDSEDLIETYFKYESLIAIPAYSQEELDVSENNYHMLSVDELSKDFNYDIKKYLSWFGFNETDEVNVCQIEAVKKGFELLNDISLADLKKCCVFSFVLSNMNKLSEQVKDIMFEYNKFAYGTEQQPPRWKRELGTMQRIFKTQFSQLYVEKHFDESAKNRVIKMVENLRFAFRKIILNQTWLSDSTKETALDKLSKMKYKIGYPNKWLDYSDMIVDDSLNYLDMYIDIERYFNRKFIERCYNKKVDKELWFISPQTVNAYYNPVANEIVFPAGILQDPFFIKDGSNAENYGSIGVVIGHEMTHGFDTNGRIYSPSGVMDDWWTGEDAEKFKALTIDTIEHFNMIETGIDGLNVNGELTKNENIADCGGLRIAYLAFLYENDGHLTKQQQQDFFLAYAQTWSSVYTDESLEYQVKNNTHSPCFARVNGTLPMIDEWYDAFDIIENDKLYINPEKRSKLWKI